MIIRRLSIFALSTAMLAMGVSANALTATQKVEKEITVQQADGTSVTQRVSADQVTPGEKIVYTVDFLNDSAEPASDLVLAMPVPSDVRFLEGSADRDGAIVKYSTDGGASFFEQLLAAERAQRALMILRTSNGKLRVQCLWALRTPLYLRLV